LHKDGSEKVVIMVRWPGFASTSVSVTSHWWIAIARTTPQTAPQSTSAPRYLNWRAIQNDVEVRKSLASAPCVLVASIVDDVRVITPSRSVHVNCAPNYANESN